MRLLRIVFLLAAAAAAAPASPALAGPSPSPLSVHARTVLDGALKLTVDPRGCTRIRYAVKTHDAFGRTENATAEVWLRPAAGNRPAVVLDMDGEDPRVPERYEIVDFVMQSRQLLADEDYPFDQHVVPPIPALVRAAWLHRLGEDGLAERWLATRPPLDRKEIQRQRKSLAWYDYSRGVNAYIVRDDAEAVLRFSRFAQRYADLDADFGTPAHELAAELRRREGRKGQTPASAPPTDFTAWPADRRVGWLIDQLDEVDARQDGQPGGVSFHDDWRVTGLIALGESAVPALIDCVERDRRLTRSMHFWRDFNQSRTVLAVREPALAAVSSILRVNVFEATATGDNFTREGEQAAVSAAARLRAYWQQFGALEADERMMKVLADPASPPKAAREAASNLVTLGAREVRGTTVWADRAGPGDAEAKHRAVAKYTNPTIAEAMLAAMDREVMVNAARRDTAEQRRYNRREVAREWMALIAQLGDARIAPAVAERFEREQDADAKPAFVAAALKLGDAAPLATWAMTVAAGAVPVLGLESWGGGPMNDALHLLHDNPTAATRAARRAIAAPSHPWYGRLRESYMKPAELPAGPYVDDWLMMKILRPLLDDVSPAGITYRLEDGSLSIVRAGKWSSSGPAPRLLGEFPARRDRVEARLCDAAGVHLVESIRGLPPFHPLLVDADVRLEALRREVDRRLAAAEPEMGGR